MPERIPSHLKTDRELRDWAFARIDDLEHEVAMLRAASATQRDGEWIRFLSARLKLTAGQAAMLDALGTVAGVIRSRAQLHAAGTNRFDHIPDHQLHTVAVQINRVRKIVGAAVVQSHAALGYSLTDAGAFMMRSLRHEFDGARAAA